MLVANLVFSSWNSIGLAGGFLLLAGAILFWGYWRKSSLPVRWTCLGLKILGFLALAFCLLEPLWSGQRVKPGANLFAVVADNSQGLQIRDRGEKESRGELLRGLLDPQKRSWQSSL